MGSKNHGKNSRTQATGHRLKGLKEPTQAPEREGSGTGRVEAGALLKGGYGRRCRGEWGAGCPVE